MIGPFIDRRLGTRPVTLPHPAMAEPVADTYGVIVYQEQVLRIACVIRPKSITENAPCRSLKTLMPISQDAPTPISFRPAGAIGDRHGRFRSPVK